MVFNLSAFGALVLFSLLASSSASVRGNHQGPRGQILRQLQDDIEVNLGEDLGRMGGSGNRMSKKNPKSMKEGMRMSSKRTYYGDASPLGDGYIRTFAVLDGDETYALGIKFDLDSLSNLPTTPSDGQYDIRDADGNTVVPLSGHTYELEFPQQVADDLLPFRHATLNWNPNGHPPPNVYMVPHFDFHFYTITSERRNTCVLPPLIDDACPLTGPMDPPFANVDCAGLAFYTEPLPADQTPAGYILVPGPAEPAMGNHMIPVMSAEFQEGGSFTHTWIYGVEGGNINFYEPMITIDYLQWLVHVLDDYSTGGDDDDDDDNDDDDNGNEAPVDPNGGTILLSRNKITVTVPLPSIPQAYPEAGMYPTAYVISYDSFARKFSIVLTEYRDFPKSSFVQNLPCPSIPRTVYGDAVAIGDGSMRTFAVLEGGETSVLGVKFDLTSLDDLPTAPSDGQYDIRDAEGNTVAPLSGHTFELFFPDEAVTNVLPFRHVGVNWNPNGHPPPDVYTVPHFDFHFYTITSERRNTCVLPPLANNRCPLDDPNGPPFANVDCAGLAFYTEPLPPDQMPEGYILIAGPEEPAMGNHMIPTMAAEFQGGPFTHTWIYGAEGGNINFYEPMITIEYLQWLVQVLADYSPGDDVPDDSNGGTIKFSDNKIVVEVPFPSLPAAYPEAGMYPTSYHITYDASDEVFVIALTDYQDFRMSSSVQDLPCPSIPPVEENKFYGDAVPLGNGYIRTFAVVEEDKTKVLGVKFDADSLDELPTTPSDGQYDIRDADGNTVVPLSGHTFELEFPQQVADDLLPFRHAALNWNPNGHPPPNVYMVPHFDFHFYTITSERRNTCVLPPLLDDACPLTGPMDPPFANVDCAGLAFYTEPLPADQMPAGYILVPGPAEPAMGNHMIPVMSAEFQEGGSFTHTWIYGVEGGNINFYEPMITIDYLQWLKVTLENHSDGDEVIGPELAQNGGTIRFSKNKITVDVPFPSVPEAYPEAGMYPTSYHIAYDLSEKMFTVALMDYEFFPMSSVVQDLPCPSI